MFDPEQSKESSSSFLLKGDRNSFKPGPSDSRGWENLTMSFFNGHLPNGMDLNREGRKGQRLGTRGTRRYPADYYDRQNLSCSAG